MPRPPVLKHLSKPLPNTPADQSGQLVIPQRRTLLAGSLALGALAVLGNVGTARSANASNIAVLEGDVFVNDVAAQSTTLIITGDTIRTGPASRVLFSIGDSAFHVRANTHLVVERDHLFSVSGLRMITGAVIAVFGKGPRRNIFTASGTIGIRGTGVYCAVAEDSTYFCTCYGTTDLSCAKSHEIVESSHHSARVLSDKGDVTARIQKSPMRDHQDAELEQLEQLVGRSAAWAS